jgi:hypothetical protein
VEPPAPVEKVPEWTRQQYDDLTDILQRVKDMEDRLGGCPCEDASKMDFLKTIKDRLDALEAKEKAAHDKSARYAYPTDNTK